MDNNNNTKVTWKTSLIFSTIVFFILVCTFFNIAAILIFLIHFNLITLNNPILILIIFGMVSLIIGTVLSSIVGRRLLVPIVEISEASMKVAKGDFSIRVDEDSRSEEVRQMSKNFNIMTHQLASTEILRNDFISNVSHEFKTPLSAIEGYATLLQSKSMTEEKKEAYTTKIIENTKRLSLLCENILQISRLESKKLNFEEKLFSLDELIREVVILYEKDWSDKNITIDIDLGTFNFYGSKELIFQIWQNLLENAIKFTDKNGRITITLEQIANELCVSIKDNGIGMNEETRKRVFEKFYQGDTSHKTEGNGLGLALIKKIIDLYNGRIEIVSELGKGSNFLVYLPLKNTVN